MDLKRDPEFGHLVGIESHPLVKPYTFVEFPKWKYKTETDDDGSKVVSVIVHTAEEEAELGEGWRDSEEDHQHVTTEDSEQV